MRCSARSLVTVMALLFPVALAAQNPVPPVTLGEWLARDRAIAKLPDEAARRAELALLHQSVIEGLSASRADPPAGACLPAPGTSELASTEIGNWLQSRPASEHDDTMRVVLARFLVQRFPCP